MAASVYLFARPPCWLAYTAVSLPVPLSDVADLVPSLSDSTEQLYPCLRVPGMSWVSACGRIQYLRRRLCLIPHSPSKARPPLSDLRLPFHLVRSYRQFPRW